MKKIIVSFLLTVFFAIAFSQTTTQQPLGGSASLGGLVISNTSLYSPYPAEPGKYIDLWVRVQYVGLKGPAEEVVCQVNPTFPFSIETGDPIVSNIGLISSYQEVLLKYRIRIDANAVAGTNKLKYGCKMKGFDYFEMELPVYIQPQDAVLTVDKIESIPSTFNPGQIGTVKIYLKNIASVTLKDITIKYDISSADLPFAPVNSTIEQRITALEQDKTTDVEFDIAANPDAVDKVYKIPVVLTYYDILGKSYSRNMTTSIQVQTKPEVFLVHEQTTIVKNGTKNTVTVSIVNKGLAKIKFLTASFAEPQTDEYHLLSPSDVYVGDINSDDSETATFDLYINSEKSSISLPININFKDVNGNIYEMQSNVPVLVFNSEEAVRFGLEKRISTDPLIIVVGGIVILYVLYRILRAVTKKKRE